MLQQLSVLFIPLEPFQGQIRPGMKLAHPILVQIGDLEGALRTTLKLTNWVRGTNPTTLEGLLEARRRRGGLFGREEKRVATGG